MNKEQPQDLRSRTSEFALRIIKLYSSLPKTTEAQVLGKQVLRSGTSIGAHYREGYRAKSDADIIHKFETAAGIGRNRVLAGIAGHERDRSSRKDRPASEGNKRIACHLYNHRDQDQGKNWKKIKG